MEKSDQKVKLGRGNADFVVYLPIKESGYFQILKLYTFDQDITYLFGNQALENLELVTDIGRKLLKTSHIQHR